MGLVLGDEREAEAWLVVKLSREQALELCKAIPSDVTKRLSLFNQLNNFATAMEAIKRELAATRERLERAEAAGRLALLEIQRGHGTSNHDATCSGCAAAQKLKAVIAARETGSTERGKDSATAPTKEA